MEKSIYFDNIIEIVETIEINFKVRKIQDNSEKLKGYWEIGKLLVEAQGKETRAKYGDNLIKKWATILTDKYGKFYGVTNLKYMRKFYNCFQISHAARDQLTWTHYRTILSLKNENERNYYINQVILHDLSTRELIDLIKSDAFNRLSYADKENIKLITNDEYKLDIKDMIKDPIILKVTNKDKLSEKVLHKYVIEMLEKKFLELGVGFTLAGHEYVINVEGHRYKLDLLFFNYKINAFVVVELKIKSMKIKDIDQLKFYVDLVNTHIKEKSNNKSIGLLIAREKDKFVVKYATNKDILVTSYELTN